MSESVLTLGGTGPNGTSQLPVLELLGYENIQALKKINIISGSSFGYFIYLAFYSGHLLLENYRSYDKGTRVLHKASLIKVIKHIVRGDYKHASLYDNSKVKETVNYLLAPGFCDRPLSSFPSNMSFWAYCVKNNTLVEINSTKFPNMKVWEAIASSLSVKAIHGHFEYGGYHLVDPMFSPKFKDLVRTLLKNNQNHLFLNYKKTSVSRSVIFLKNQPLRLPLLSLLYDFFSFTCNFKNPRVIRTHHHVLSLLAHAPQT